MDLKHAALEYAARGWAVFPLHGITDENRCTCGGAGCSSPGKHPRTFSGFKDATTDARKITAWWDDMPDSNIGVATGAVSGIIVVDADSEVAAETWGADPNNFTLTASTGRGAHFYYQHPGTTIKNTVQFGQHLDLRGDGGYVVAPPSRHISGSDYEWSDRYTDLAPLPADFLPDTGRVAPALGTKPTLTTPMQEGGRNATMTRHVGTLFARGMNPEEVLTLAKGLNATQCVPPLPDYEIERIVRNIANAEWSKRPDFGGVDPDALAMEYAAEAMADLDVDFKTLPPWFSSNLQSLVGPPIPGTTTIIGARSGCGKTTAMVNQAQHLVTQGHRAFYIGTEMKPSLLLRKMAANALGYDERFALKNDWAALPGSARGNIADWINDFQKEHAKDLMFCPDWVLDTRKLMGWMEWAATHGYTTIFLDHLHEVQWGDNETADMAKGVTAMEEMVKTHGITLLAAAQLRRGQHDEALVDYYPPPQSALKQCGKLEEKAALILMLHRTLKASAKAADLDMVRRGQLRIHEVAEHGVVSLHVAKDRIGGQRDESLRLYLRKGRLYDRLSDADADGWEVV